MYYHGLYIFEVRRMWGLLYGNLYVYRESPKI